SLPSRARLTSAVMVCLPGSESTQRQIPTRKSEVDAASARGFGHTNPATVQLHRPPRDRQAQSRAAVASGTVRGRAAAPAEPLEDLRPLRLGDPRALIEHFELQAPR